MFKWNKRQLLTGVILLIIVVVAFLVRLYRIDTPIADWHSWRQADTAAVARNFYEEGFNPLYPRGDDISVISQTNKFNVERYRFVEFPIYNSVVYFAYLLTDGVETRTARLVSVFFSLGTLIFIYLITRKYMGVKIGLLSALVFGILPYSVFYSRVVLPEPSLLFWSMGALYFGDRWIHSNSKKLFIISSLFAAFALLTKPTAAFLLLPLFYSYFQKEQKIFAFRWRYLFWAIIVLTPFILWRLWMGQYPEGIPGSDWLFNKDGIRYRPAFWKWILGDRFGREILWVSGTVLFFIGLILRPKNNEGWFMHILAFGSFLYLIVLASGNVQHDYYQVLVVPAISVFTARGFYYLLAGSKDLLPKLFTIPIALLFFVLMIYFSWIEVKGLYQVNNGAIIEAGERADAILPKDAKVVAPYMGDSAFLYHTNRSGISVMSYPPDRLHRDFGIDYYISVNFDDDANKAMQRYEVIEKTPRYVIIDLTKEKSAQ